MTASEPVGRHDERAAFAHVHGWGDADIQSLTPDASFRSYARLRRGGEGRMLMDAPPKHENLKAYLDVTAHLRALGLRVAETFEVNLETGFAFIEDMGDDTFTRLLDAGQDDMSLYLLATDVLKTLHAHPNVLDLELKPYDMTALLREVELFVDWFVPAVRGAHANPAEKAAYMNAWEVALADISVARDALVLRDYHVDNLMITPEAPGGQAADVRHCGLLDYQDALIGSRAYDLISLVEDARRDVRPAVKEAVMARYAEGLDTAGRKALERDMNLLGAQRHAKVAGIFIRLSKRDAKPIYLRHIPRVLRLLEACLQAPELAAVRDATEAMLPNYRDATF